MADLTLVERLRRYGTGSPDSLLLMRGAADKLKELHEALLAIEMMATRSTTVVALGAIADMARKARTK